VTGLIYRLPVPVQPMKAVSAVLVTSGLTPCAVAATGIILGIVLLGLGLTGAIDRLARAIPQSVIAGLQLGHGAGKIHRKRIIRAFTDVRRDYDVD